VIGPRSLGTARPVRPRWSAVQRRTVYAICIGTMTVTSVPGLAAVALPDMARSLNLGVGELGSVPLVYSITLGLSLIPWGLVSPYLGDKTAYVGGLVLLGLGALVTDLAQGGVGLILIGRALQGLGAASTITNNRAIAIRVFEPADRGRPLSLLQVGSALGAILGIGIGGVVVAAAGWQQVYLLMAGLCALGAILALAWLPPGRRVSRAENPIGASLLGTGDGSLWAPFRRLSFRLALLGCLLIQSARASILFIAPFELTETGAAASIAALALVALPVGELATARTGGHLADQRRGRTAIGRGLGIASAGLIVLTIIAALHPSIWTTGLLLLAVGLGFGLFHSANAAAALRWLPSAALPSGSTLLAGTITLGMTVGVAISSAIWSSVSAGSLDSSSRTLGILYAIPAALVLAAAVIASRTAGVPEGES
jgi:MFS family permease